MEKTVYLSVGSNLGDRARSLQDAIERLRSIGEVAAVSSFYETEPVGDLHQPWFLNCAVMLRTEKMPRQLLAAVMAIEQALGRKRTVAKGPRTIDIDILLFGSFVVNVPSLIIPHPAMHERRFVLQPLAELAPAVRHPVFRRTIRELLEDFPLGPPRVRKLDGKITEDSTAG
jgi:2-amino-4-hydroxy-6-hydroxymethyldihydropteridine diphosphokinase